MIDKVQLIRKEIERQIEEGKVKCQQSKENNARESLVAWTEHVATCGKLLVFIDSIPEEHESEDERIRKEIISYIKSSGAVTNQNWTAWLEKQAEQKSIEKVEPKFKAGDWVVWDNKISCHIDNIYQGKESLMYTLTDVYNMTRSYSVKDFDNDAHLWIIQDAKDGDVLAIGDIICIFKKMDTDGLSIFWTHCEIIGNSEFGLGFSFSSNTIINPATKEQRDLLFQKMKEAEYEWDAEKKELKKIEYKPDFCHHEVDLSNCSEEYRRAYYDGWNNCNQQHAQLKAEQKPSWSEEDERILNKIQDHIREFYVDKKGYPYVAEPDSPEMMENNWLKSLKDRVQPKLKQDWNEKDREMLDNCLGLIQEIDSTQEEQKWLKSIKSSHYRWKPSEEQMEAIKYFIDFHRPQANASTEGWSEFKHLESLYNGLKKL